MRKRIKRSLIVLAVLATAGIIYCLFASFGHSLPCVFYEITGLYCPGCGSTRVFRRLMTLDLHDAFRANPVVFCLVPFLAAVFARQTYLYIRYGHRKREKWSEAGCIIAVIILLIFGIIRNIPGFELLQPL